MTDGRAGLPGPPDSEDRLHRDPVFPLFPFFRIQDRRSSALALVMAAWSRNPETSGFRESHSQFGHLIVKAEYPS